MVFETVEPDFGPYPYRKNAKIISNLDCVGCDKALTIIKLANNCNYLAVDQQKDAQSPFEIKVTYSEDDYDRDDDYSYDPPAVEHYWDTYEFVPVHAQMHLDYISGSGESSQREVTVRDYDGSCYLRGTCHLRNEWRTFRIDRIQRCTDTETGEVIADIPKYLKQKYESSPEHIAKKLFDQNKDSILVLFYVGKADGQLRKPERDIIKEFFNSLSPGHEILDEAIDYILNSLEVPTLHSFKLAVGRVGKHNIDQLEEVNKAAIKIVATQKTINHSEKEALDYLSKKIGLIKKANDKEE